MGDNHEPDDLDLLIQLSEQEFPGFTQRLQAEIARQDAEAARQTDESARGGRVVARSGGAVSSSAKSKSRVREPA